MAVKIAHEGRRRWPKDVAVGRELANLILSTVSVESTGGARLKEAVALLREVAGQESSSEGRMDDLLRLVGLEWRMGERDSAVADAQEALRLAPKNVGSWNYGNVIHVGNTVLGLVELARGNRKGAIEFLRASCKTKGSPQLASLGPNMKLAQSLLELGEGKVVVEYLECVAGFWTFGTKDGKVRAWIDEVKKGSTPSFGANLSDGLY